MDELYVRNLRREIEEDELPINRLKRCIINGLYAIVITILHSNSFSKIELLDAFNLALDNSRHTSVTDIICDAILDELNILDNNNECVLK
jgi:hypothetical protein